MLSCRAVPLCKSPTGCGHELLLTRLFSYRIAIWTREGPADANTPETDAIMKRIMTIGRHFKTSVLGYNIDEQIGGGYAVGTTFELHSDSADKKKKATKITV